MRFTRRRRPMAGAQNRPTLAGARVEVPDYTEEIARGFTSVYRLLLEHREGLLADEGPLARFARDEVRVVLRPTSTYAALLAESFHPDVLRDALDRDRLFDRLWAAVEQRPVLARVIAAERDALLRGDIPLFTTHPTTRDLSTGTGAPIADVLEETGLSLVRRRVGQLGERNLAQQLWLLRASLATLPTATRPAPGPAPRRSGPPARADRDRLLAAAQAVGDRLEAMALRGDGAASWIGLAPNARDRWTLLPLGVDLYSGLAGPALFLAHLGAVTEQVRYGTLAREALTALRRQVERDRSAIKSIGGFDGWGGILYTLSHLGILWDEPALLDEAEAIVGLLPDLIEQDERWDIIAGAAGCLGGLISVQRCRPSDRTLDAALRCGDRLLAGAQPMTQGIGWVLKGPGTRPLAGFAHGAAGIAWALLELAAWAGEERFRAAAHAALAYERTLFSAEAGNWLDLREHAGGGRADESRARCMTAWCHGAPGIGLARLRSLPHLDDATTRAEIGTALATTLAEGFGRNLSLCHGDLGNLEFVVQAGERLGDPRWRLQADRLAALVLEGIDHEGWRCGVPMGVESPGLMTGLAGIGYGLLRLAEPSRVPSVLVLEPPMPQV
jgi:type 2 lantibiotic biosynthesis protein LanM